jgi:pimeloyl-ACP methyl ester carboxylesterase
VTVEVLRTPDARFAGLPGWPYEPRYLQQGGLRMHYVDEGPHDAPVTVLCLHGEPSWAYLYRKMIPVFKAAGLRVLAPDFFGFGRSDKPVDDAWYTFARHRDSMLAFLDALAPTNVMLVCQDWGGLIGLTLPMARPAIFSRLLVMNTGLGTGTVTEGFRHWRAYNRTQPDLAVGRLMQRGCPALTDAEAAAYDAPFPDMRHKAGVRAFPDLVPDMATMGDDAPGAALSREAAAFWRERWTGDSFMAIGMADPVLGEAAMRPLQHLIRGCPEPMCIADGGHFVQEWGAPIAEAALRHFGLLPR